MTTAQSTAPRRRRLTPARMRGRAAPYLFVAPFVLIFLAFSIYPLIFTGQLSFTNWRGAGTAQWIGWGNYIYLLRNPDFWHSLGNSAILWVLIIPVQMLLALIVAVLLNDATLRLRGMYRVAFMVPYVMPLVAIAQIWVVLFDEKYGPVNALLSLLGLPDIGWLTTSQWSKPTLALLFLWKTTGFIVIILLSGLQAIDASLYEAAEVDGASAPRMFVSLTVPLLRPTIMFAVVIQTIAVFQMFAEPYNVTQGGPYGSTTTAGYYLYNHITRGDLGTGAANSFLLIIVVMAISVLFARVLTPKDRS